MCGGRGINAWGVVITKNSKKELKFFFSRTTWPILTILDTEHPLDDGAQNFTNNAHSILKRKNHILSEMCFVIGTVSQVNDVIHGPFVQDYHPLRPIK